MPTRKYTLEILVRIWNTKGKIVLCFLLYTIYTYYSRGTDIKITTCYSFPYDYPPNNLKEVVNDLILNGFTDVEPVNNISFNVHYLHSGNCSTQTELVIMVKSFVGNIRQRHAIRETWGKCHDEKVEVRFVLGFVKYYYKELKKEYSAFKDIILGSFHDEYRNNIYKTMLSYQWIVSHCNQSSFILFVDDDYFVNIPNTLKFARDKGNAPKSVMYGQKQCNKPAVRSRKSEFGKWYISMEEYQYDFYPPYLSGGSILTHIGVVRKMQMAFPFVKPIWIDDVYVSIVAHKMNVELVNENRFSSKKIRFDVKDVMSSHYYNNTELLYQAWRTYKAKSFLHYLINSKSCP